MANIFKESDLEKVERSKLEEYERRQKCRKNLRLMLCKHQMNYCYTEFLELGGETFTKLLP